MEIYDYPCSEGRKIYWNSELVIRLINILSKFNRNGISFFFQIVLIRKVDSLCRFQNENKLPTYCLVIVSLTELFRCVSSG